MKQGYTAGFNFGNKKPNRKQPQRDRNQASKNLAWGEAEENRCFEMWWKNLMKKGA